jgi:two-component system LytT family sensor kinase
VKPAIRSPRAREAVKLGLVVFGVYTVFGIFLTGYRLFAVLAEGETLSRPEVFGKAIEEMSAAYGLALLFPVVLLLVRRYPIVRGAALARLPGYLLMVVGFGLVHTSFMGKSRTILFPLFGLGAYDYGIQSLRFPMEFFFQAIHFVTVVGFIHFFLYHQRMRDREVRAARLETQLQRARLANLQAQLHPHFLFNTLNAISSLM